MGQVRGPEGGEGLEWGGRETRARGPSPGTFGTRNWHNARHVKLTSYIMDSPHLTAVCLVTV